MAAKISKVADGVIKVYEHVLKSFHDATEKAEENMRYVINQPYTKIEIEEAAAANKPLLKYNILIPALLAIVGNEQLYKRKAIFKARDKQTAEVVELLQARWEAIIDEQNLEEKIQTALFDALISQRGGWIQVDIKMNDEGYRDYTYEVGNNLRVFPDPEFLATDFMMDRCRYLVKEGWYAAEDVIEDYDLREKAYDMIKRELEVSWFEKLQREVRRFYNKEYSQRISNIYNKDNDLVLVIELQKKVNTLVYRCHNGEGLYSEHTPEEYKEKLKEDPSLKIIDSAKKQVMRRTTIVPYFDNVVALDEDVDQPFCTFDMFNVFSYAFNIPVTEIPSLIEIIKDMQDDINKGKSQARDYITQILGGGFFMDSREEEAIKIMQEDAGKANLIVPLKNMQIKPERFAPGTIPSEVFINPDNSLAFADRITLINSAMRGETERSGESGRLFEQKVTRSITAINPYFKNTSNMRYALAVHFADTVGDTYSDIDRPIVVKQGDGKLGNAIINLEILGKVLNDVRNPSLYVELDEGEQNTIIKEENFEKLLAIYNLIIQANPQVAARLVMVLVEQAPIKNVDKFIAVIEEELQKQSAGSEEAAALDKAKLLLENRQIESEINQPATT